MRDKLNCPNCGAPISGFRCEYCGTQFWDLADMELNRDGYLRIRIRDEIISVKAIPTNISIDYKYSGGFNPFGYEYPTVNIEFAAIHIAKENEKNG